MAMSVTTIHPELTSDEARIRLHQQLMTARATGLLPQRDDDQLETVVTATIQHL